MGSGNIGTRSVPGRMRAAAVAVVGGIALALAAPLAATADTVVGTIAAPATSSVSSAAVLSPDGSHLYVSDSAAGTVSVVDTATSAVVGTMSVANAAGLAVSPDGSRLYVVASGANSLLVVDTATNAVVASVPVGGSPWAVAVSPDGARAYVTSQNGVGTSPLTVVDTATNSVVTIMPVAIGPRSIIASPDGTRLYVAHGSPTSHNISVIDTTTNTVAATIPVGVFANAVNGFAISADGSTLYAASSGADFVRVIDTATDTITATIPAGDGAYGVALTPDGTRLYVTNSLANTVSVIDTATDAVVSTIPVGTTPRSITISADGAFAYVVNGGSDTVSVIAIDTFPTIATTTVQAGTINSAYSTTIAVTGTPTPTLAVSGGALPPGLALTGDTISGTPTAADSYTFTLTGSSSVSGIPSATSQAYTLVVAAVAPDAPLTLTATDDNGTALLDWTEPTFDGGAAITGYRIERSTDDGAFTTLVADTASTAVTYTDSTVAAGRSYGYRVSALNSQDASAPSNIATFAFPAAPVAPDAPLAVTATRDNGTVVLGWTVPAFDGGIPITGYRIERSTDGAAFITLVSDTASPNVTYTDTTVASGHSYQYRVSALNGQGASVPSNIAAVAFPAAGAPGGTTPLTGTTGGTASPVMNVALAVTGSDATNVLLLGFALLLAGAAAWTVRRRTRRA